MLQNPHMPASVNITKLGLAAPYDHQLATGLASFTQSAPLYTPMTLQHEQDDLEGCVRRFQCSIRAHKAAFFCIKRHQKPPIFLFVAHTVDMAHFLRRTCLVLPFFALSLAFPTSRSTLPLCSDISQPCSCPAGATFVNTTTYATIGATASDIGYVTNNCMVHQDQYSTPC